ncbi:hypothetical protein QJS04_geneDACA007532 [Acorus gramineus]|uniref:Nuclear pore complex protein NUP88 n=1 Tax=Acorus gramineus TaxID=55184 RepID=A0AAV9B4N6_ACOGR|nr:hypothetical protein QJS04_geneDACA007532 [Acorus gramineus]
MVRFALSQSPETKEQSPLFVTRAREEKNALVAIPSAGRSTPTPTLKTPTSAAAAEIAITTAGKEEWVPLLKHPIFHTRTPPSGSQQRNLSAWDGSSRLYLWDPDSHLLHLLPVRFTDEYPNVPSIIESSPSSSKVLRPDVRISFEVHRISVNRNGSALFLYGPARLYVMYLHQRKPSYDGAVICRTVSVGSKIFFDGANALRILRVAWHPYSATHLGVLSSDSVFRLFDLSADLEQPEQEYYLQPFEPGGCPSAVSICPVAFAFGHEHLWDKFTVFVLFSDGSIYVICPVVPYGSGYSCESIDEIYKDAHAFGLNSPNSQAVSNSTVAIAWLKATFPGLAEQSVEGSNRVEIKAMPYAPLDSSLSLQGPLRRVHHNDENKNSKAECEGRAVDFLYNSVGKDSLLVVAWSNGQLHIDSLADEVQPVWNEGSSPRLRVDSYGNISGVAMICESKLQGLKTVKLDHIANPKIARDTTDDVWLGNPPPLLRLSIVDLALPTSALNSGLLSVFADPLLPERIYCLHGGGVDSVVLHFLPFSDQSQGGVGIAKAPSVHVVLSTCHDETCHPSPLCCFVPMAGSFGNSWIVGVTSSFECVAVEMRNWDTTPPISIDKLKTFSISAEPFESATEDILCKDVLNGPKVVLVPSSLSLRSLSPESFEGKSTLHHYLKLFREAYVEYAHKVFVELRHHEAYIKKAVKDQYVRLSEVKQKLNGVDAREQSLNDRINRSVQFYGHLEERLQRFRTLPVAKKKPLSNAEREFKSQLERFSRLELNAMHSSITVMNTRLRRYVQSSQTVNTPQKTPVARNRLDDQVSHLKSSLEKLALVNSENSKKLKSIEGALTRKERE